MKIAIVVAMAENRVIGVENTLPWRLPEDLKRFKEITMGHPMIMGRLTYESIGRPLPGRKTIVLTRDPEWQAPEGVVVASGIDEALRCAEGEAEKLGVECVMVVGGAKVYEQILPKAEELYVTEVHTFVDGDAYFPIIKSPQFEELSRHRFHSEVPDFLAYSFVKYQKK